MKKLKYCIQEHKASNLHYDLRLEYKGKAKSWAIPKEPSLNQKRLAIPVEDHEVSYMDFEGEIKEGYGKGSVKIWDKGSWEPLEVEENKIIAMIHGEELKGKFVLIKFKENWLFFKS
jgi:DNA ligase D-like protein (predicted 3'-phosphoesterase)|tara:strand:- start:186 stop:536 length:351 start_codon:yes stop_codon:yes gene_type:complete